MISFVIGRLKTITQLFQFYIDRNELVKFVRVLVSSIKKVLQEAGKQNVPEFSSPKNCSKRRSINSWIKKYLGVHRKYFVYYLKKLKN